MATESTTELSLDFRQQHQVSQTSQMTSSFSTLLQKCKLISNTMTVSSGWAQATAVWNTTSLPSLDLFAQNSSPVGLAAQQNSCCRPAHSTTPQASVLAAGGCSGVDVFQQLGEPAMHGSLHALEQSFIRVIHKKTKNLQHDEVV